MNNQIYYVKSKQGYLKKCSRLGIEVEFTQNKNEAPKFTLATAEKIARNVSHYNVACDVSIS